MKRKPVLLTFNGDRDRAFSLKGLAHKRAFQYQLMTRPPIATHLRLNDGSHIKVVNAGDIVRVFITGVGGRPEPILPRGFIFKLIDPLGLSNFPDDSYLYLEGNGADWELTNVAEREDIFPNGPLYGIYDWSDDRVTLSWGTQSYFEDGGLAETLDHPYIDTQFNPALEDSDVFRTVYQQGRVVADLDIEEPDLIDRTRHSVAAAFVKTVENEARLCILLRRRGVSLEHEGLLLISKPWDPDPDAVDLTPDTDYDVHGSYTFTDALSALEILNIARVNEDATEARVDVNNLIPGIGKTVGIAQDERYTFSLGSANTLSLSFTSKEEDSNPPGIETFRTHGGGGDYYEGGTYINTLYDYQRIDAGSGSDRVEDRFYLSNGTTIATGLLPLGDKTPANEISLMHHRNLSYLVSSEDFSGSLLNQEFWVDGTLQYSVQFDSIPYTTYFTAWSQDADNMNTEAMSFSQELKVDYNGNSFASETRFSNFRFLGNADENATESFMETVGLGVLGLEAFGNNLVQIKHIGVI